MILYASICILCSILLFLFYGCCSRGLRYQPPLSTCLVLQEALVHQTVNRPIVNQIQHFASVSIGIEPVHVKRCACSSSSVVLQSLAGCCCSPGQRAACESSQKGWAGYKRDQGQTLHLLRKNQNGQRKNYRDGRTHHWWVLLWGVGVCCLFFCC